MVVVVIVVVVAAAAAAAAVVYSQDTGVWTSRKALGCTATALSTSTAQNHAATWQELHSHLQHRNMDGEWMNEWMQIFIWGITTSTQTLACWDRQDGPGVHTKACVFTEPGWTRCAHKSLRVHSARMNQVCTHKLACSYRHDEPGVHTNVCVFRSSG